MEKGSLVGETVAGRRLLAGVGAVAENTPAAALAETPVAGASRTADHIQEPVGAEAEANKRAGRKQAHHSLARTDIPAAGPEAVDIGLVDNPAVRGTAVPVAGFGACSAETDQIWPYHPSLEIT